MIDDTEVLPPWIVFPSPDPDLDLGNWRQGTGEQWLHDTWLPFWNQLSYLQRLAYLGKYDASPLWRQHLLHCWVPKVDADRNISPDAGGSRDGEH